MGIIIAFIFLTSIYVISGMFAICDLALDKSDAQRNRITGKCAWDGKCKKPYWNVWLYYSDETCLDEFPKMKEMLIQLEN
jgi:hypothetical protein